MPRCSIPAVESHSNIVLVASAHSAFETLVEFVRIVTTDTLNPNLATILANLLRLGNELNFLAALRTRLYGINVFRKVKSSLGHGCFCGSSREA